MRSLPALLVFSHLRWSFVWQRPQQLLSRLAQDHRVYFFEEPTGDADQRPAWLAREQHDNVTVLHPHTPSLAPGFHEEQYAHLQPLLRHFLQHEGLSDWIAWFYTPLALPLLAGLEPRALIYDCMDELSAFRFAPPSLLSLESELLAKADLVFTGGPSLYEAKRHRHPRVYCFPSSVDLGHFGRAREPLAEPADQERVGHPRLGFFGVIDERFDTELVAGISAERPDWQICLVGPVVKIAPESLPHAPNIHYFGQRRYEELPAFLANWDICLLPFARNEATRFISPTKTLEYMAAEKPIVSTPIRDVAEPYHDLVRLGETPAEFIAHIEQLLAEPAAARQYRVQQTRLVLANTSWDRTAQEMRELLEPWERDRSHDAPTDENGHAPENGPSPQTQRSARTSSPIPAGSSQQASPSPQQDLSTASPAVVAPANPQPKSAQGHSAKDEPPRSRISTDGPQAKVAANPQSINQTSRSSSLSPISPDARRAEVVVIGAGPTGLSAAYHLQQRSLLLERHPTVGGWCRSIQLEGFTFDYAGHIMFSNDPYVQELYQLLLQDNVHWQDREAWIYSHGVYTRYPFQGALYGLPPEVIKECILGAIESRYGREATARQQSLAQSPLDYRSAATTKRLTSATSGALSAPSAAAGHKSSLSSASSAATGLGSHLAGGSKATVKKQSVGKSPTTSSPATSSPATSSPATSSTGTSFPGREEATSSSTRSPVDFRAPMDRKPCNQLDDCCADGLAESTLPHLPQHEFDFVEAAHTEPEAENFEEFIYRVWGAGIAKHFAIPYNRKLWAVPLTQMETSWLGGRVPLPDLEEMIEGALRPVPKPMGPNARFGYPLRGGFQALMEGFLPHLRGEVQLNADVARVFPREHRLELTSGEDIQYESLISTMPLPVLVQKIGEQAPMSIRRAASALRYISVRCVHLGIGRPQLTEKHWIYYPEETVFHRIFVQGNASPHCNPPGGFGLTCEITYHAQFKPLPCDGEELIQKCIEDCHRVGIFTAEDPVWVATQVDLPHAYVVYDHARVANVTLIRNWLKEHDIILAGRYSEWEYYNSDHAFLAGKKAAEAVSSQQPT